jgi:molybdate-binding protein
MINRQRGSGTRALLEFLISTEGLDRSLMQGYENEEMTHAAVAALIAGNQADAGFGVEAAASAVPPRLRPGLHGALLSCVPFGRPREPAIAAMLETLRGDTFRDRVARLRGYDATHAGEVLEDLAAESTSPQELK